MLSYDIYYQTPGINSSHLEYSLNKNGKQIYRILSEKCNNMLVFGYIREYTKSIGSRDMSSIVLKYFTNNKFNFIFSQMAAKHKNVQEDVRKCLLI